MIFLIVVETLGVPQAVCACLTYLEAEQLAAQFRARAKAAVEQAVASKAEIVAARIFGDKRTHDILTINVRIEQVPIVDVNGAVTEILQTTMRRAMKLTGTKTSDD